MQKYINQLEEIITNIPKKLKLINESVFNYKESPTKWSKKEILGHLIDSATNNHHRFVRGQFEKKAIIFYDQNLWNTSNFYQGIDIIQLIIFWEYYNKHILEIMKNMDTNNFKNEVYTSQTNKFTLEFLFCDYVEHLEHHFSQIFQK